MNSLKSTILIPLMMAMLAGNVDADVCTTAPVKTLRHLYGVVVDFQGSPIPETQVTIFKAGKAIVTAKTTDGGEFNFGNLSSGHYDVLLENRSFRRFQFSVTVSKSDVNSARQLRIKLTAGAPLNDCEEIQVVEVKK